MRALVTVDAGAAETRPAQGASAQNYRPSVGLLLGADWFRFTSTPFTPANHFGDDNKCRRTYGHDDLVRIRRLRDNNAARRSAFLQAGGVHGDARTVRQADCCSPRSMGAAGMSRPS